MTSIEDKEKVARSDNLEIGQKIPIRIKLDSSEEQMIELENGTSVSKILEILATERGCNVEELVLTREEEGEPLALDLVIDTEYPNERPHHVHCLGEVTVVVNYQASYESRVFKRFEAVKDVLAWAIKLFNIDSSLATELVLVCHGQKNELPEREHIGHLAGKDSNLTLDLVRGDIANGYIK